ncbi:MAG: C25 family cysteine peptidase [Candidatus Delongbacteria bacterium]|nr:C25 family cysteine peptidase [Candidatus Delongbacteria bacterium]
MKIFFRGFPVESVTINSTQVEILNSKEYNVYPTQPPLKTDGGDNVEFVEPNEDVYSSGLLYPEKIYEIISEVYRFGYHIVTIEFYPIQYDTGSKELKIHTDINFTLNYSGSRELFVLPEKQSEKIYEMTRNMIMAQVENPNDMALLSGGAKNVIEQTNVVNTRKVNKSMPLPAFETPEYIIITSEDLKPEFQKLADWKTKKGVPAIIVDVEDIEANYTGDLKERIRTYLSEKYSKFGVFYVLLGGDVNIIPTAPDNAYPRSYDEYYMDVVGDTGLELLVGRASVEDINEAEVFVSKTINYEKLTGLNDEERSYVGNLLLLNGIDGEITTTDDNGQKYIYSVYDYTDRGKYEWISDKYAEKKNINSLKLYEWTNNSDYRTDDLLPGNMISNRMNAIDALNGNFNLNDYNGNNTQNNNFGMVLHFDHSSAISLGAGAHQYFDTKIPPENLYSSDAYDLENNNGNTVFSNILLTEGCNPGYLFQDCIAERLLNNPNGGSVAVLANVESGLWGTAELHKRFMEAAYNLNDLAVYEHSNHISIAHQIMGVGFGKTLFGDPELPIWTKVPEYFDNVTVDIINADGEVGHIDNQGNYTGAYITTGENQITVNTGETIETIACLNKSGEAYAYNQFEGSITFAYTPDTVDGNIDLTVTGKDYLPYELRLPHEVSNQAYVFIEEKIVFDGNSGSSIGDSDGFIDGGEKIEYPIILKNTSMNTITGVSGSLSTESQYTTILYRSSAYNDLPPMNYQTCLDNFIFLVDKDIPDDEIIDFVFTITTDQDVFEETFSLRAKNSNLHLTDRLELMEIDPEFEHYNVTLEMSNYGNSELNNLSVNISTISSSIQNIQPSTLNYLFIDSLETDASTGTFSFDLFDGNHDALINIQIVDENYRTWHEDFNTSYTSIEGYNVDLNSVVTMSENNGITLIWDPLKDQTGNSCRFNIYRSTELNGEYKKLNLTPIGINADGKMSYNDYTCEEYTTYYYKFSTLFADQTNINVGQMSDAVETSTLLSTVPNWPVKSVKACQLENAPTVTDINNDGKKEIFGTGRLGANGYVVGFNGDGTEITNYLGDPEDVDGFAVIDGNRIWSKCAVGDIDNDGVKEIVLTTRSATQSLCVYKYIGSTTAPVLMDFPIDLGTILAEPVIADIDNNGINDIIIADQDGKITVCEYSDIDKTIKIKPDWDPYKTTKGWTSGGIAVADVDNDNYMEIFFGGRDGIYAFNHDGTAYGVTQPFFSTANSREAFWCNPVIVNMDLKGNQEIAFVSNILNLSGNATSSNGKIYILNNDGSIYNDSWNGLPIFMYYSDPDETNNVFLPNISVADVTGDFEPEVFIGGYGKLYGFQNWGEPLWNEISNSDLTVVKANPVIADIDGDSKYEIVMASYTNNLIYAYNTEDGTPVLGWPLKGNGATPFVGDVNRNNSNEIVTTDNETSTIVYQAEGSAEYVEWQSYRANPENTGVYRKTLYEVPVGGTITLKDQQKVVVDSDQYIRLLENSKLILNSDSELIIKEGCILRLYEGSELIVESGANLVLEEGSYVEINGNVKITGNIENILSRIEVTYNSKLTIGAGSNIEFRSLSTFRDNSELIIEADAVLKYGSSTSARCGRGSKITINGGSLIAGEQCRFYGEWEGIVAGVGSTVSMYFASISGAVWGINAQASDIKLTRTSFIDCDNGIWLLNCDNYDLYDCYFNGKGSGAGIRITESTGTLKSNTVQNHSSGIVAVSCSPLITENYINDNATCGIALYGYNTYPQLLNPASTNDDLNNSIVNNGLTTTGENGSQIFMMYRANAYLNNGHNNIYSGNENEIPVVPCIKTVSDIGVSQQKIEVSQIVEIQADYNYWGTNDITEENRSDYFNLWVDIPKGYTIDYNPYAEEAFEAGLPGTIQYSTNEPPTQEEQLLTVAMMLEDKGVYVASIKKYEAIIEKYPDSPEYYIATSRLPQVLAKEELSLDPLIRTYDEAIASEEITNKKFIKGMKISTNIKSKKYDEAIALAEELKLEAETDMERDLCDIEIAICNMMINSQQKTNGSRDDDLALINKLVDGLLGEEKSGSSEITDFILPETTKLFQNYPNPFNPITQIRFDLDKAYDVNLSIYNVNGQLVTELKNKVMNAGKYTVEFDGSKLNSGLYYYKLETGKRSYVQKMLLVK